MNEHSFYRQKIQPVPEDVSRPLWSVMIPTYNCANYLRETLASVLAQDPGAEVMQIEVIDDYSTKDDPAAVVEELGRGRVKFYRQPKNVGYIKNFNTCLERSQGKLIHLLHGDDCVRDNFYTKIQSGFETEPSIGAAFCRQMNTNENGEEVWCPEVEQPHSGVLSNWIERIGVQCIIQPPSIVVRRDVYEKLGGFDSRICCAGEDWEMWVRIAAHYSMWYEPEPLVNYRVHSASLTKRCQRKGQNIRDLRSIVDINKTSLPPSIAEEISDRANKNWALYAIRIASKMLRNNDTGAAIIQLKEALKCDNSPEVINAIISMLKKETKGWLKRKFVKA
ncbi:MAG: glycosyltransferase family 2 protein [Rivularia sp. (in: cyanobacteria)]